jgi:hypothetical protein
MATPHYRPKWDTGVGGCPEYVLTPEQLDEVEELAVFHCTTEEIGCALGVCRQTFVTMSKRQPEILKRIVLGQAKGRRALRAVQYKVAMAGNTSMLVWLGKCILNQLPDSQVNIGPTSEAAGDISPEARAHLAELANAISRAALAQSTEVEVEVIQRDGTVVGFPRQN